MELVEGESLDQRIAQGPLKLQEALEIGEQIAAGLEAAHRKGVVHRDIKPENIMVGEGGHVTIMDFGLARLAEASRLTKTDETVGTVAYMSPEQTEGSGTDERTDIWSLGVVLYEMVTAQAPFKGDYDKAIMYSILNEAPEPITALRSGVPMQLEDYVGKCLAKDRKDRYQDVAHLIVDLRGLRKSLESGASRVLKKGQPAEPESVRTAGSKPWMPWAVAALMGLIALAAVVSDVNQPEPERPVRRFSFEVDPVTYEYVSVAPDGSAISYITGDSPAVWLRSLDDERPRKLEGTEGARGVATWSPDSRHLLFSTGNNEFKRIAVAGGQPVPVAEFEGSMGGMSWSPDGETIVIAFGEPPVLYEVSASGGEPRLLFEPLGGQAAANLQPYFLPAEASARALLFDVGTFTERDIYLMNLDTGEPKRIAAGAGASYAPSGHILYQTGFREPGVWAVGFSIETLEVTGEPFLVGAGLSRPRISNDNTLVAAELSVGSEPKRLIWRDREGNKLGEIGRPQPVILRPALSPDGRRVAVAGRDEVGYETDIWLHEADRPVAQRLTFDSGIEDFPAWSADGRQVSFSAEGSVLFDIFRRGLDGTQDAEVLVSTPGREAEMGWSPDESTLVFCVTNPQSNYDLKTFSPDSREIKPFLETRFNERTPAVSPDGRHIAYSSDESGKYEVYLREFPTGSGARQVSEQGGYQPRWSRDGKELYYVAQDRTLMAVKVSASTGLPVGRSEGLFDLPEFEYSTSLAAWDYDVSADGRFVVTEKVASEDQGPRKTTIRVIENWYEEFRDRSWE